MLFRMSFKHSTKAEYGCERMTHVDFCFHLEITAKMGKMEILRVRGTKLTVGGQELT